jgi:hypothetical protein
MCEVGLSGHIWVAPFGKQYFTPWFDSYVVHLIALWATFFAVHRDPSQGLRLV